MNFVKNVNFERNFSSSQKRQHGIFLSSQKTKHFSLTIAKKTKHILFIAIKKRIKHILLFFSHHHAPCKSKLQALPSWAILEFKPCFTHRLPRFEFMVLNLKIQKKGDEITTLNSRRHLCQACSLLLCLFLWQPCKHRPLRLRRLEF